MRCHLFFSGASMKILFTFLLSFIVISSTFSQQEKQTPHNFQEEVKINFISKLSSLPS